MKVNHVKSDHEISDIGIPQGTVLGPILLYMIKEIFVQPLHCQITSFADNIVLIKSGKDVGNEKLKTTEDINP